MHYDHILAALQAKSPARTSLTTLDDDYGPELKGFARWLREWARGN